MVWYSIQKFKYILEVFSIHKEMDIIEFKSFRIEDKPLIDGFFKIHHYEQIDCTFNTLFL